MMKRLLITLTAAVLVAGSLWAKDDEIIVTRELTTSQRNALPEKTISVEMKRLSFNKKATPGLVDAITQVMDTIDQEDYMNRTFVLLLEPREDGAIGIAAHSDDIVSRGRQHQDSYYGVLTHGRHHFVLLSSKDNVKLLEQTFKRQSKVKFVLEFQFVSVLTPHYLTNVIGRWSPVGGLTWLTVIINEDMNADRKSFDRPAHSED